MCILSCERPWLGDVKVLGRALTLPEGRLCAAAILRDWLSSYFVSRVRFRPGQTSPTPSLRACEYTYPTRPRCGAGGQVVLLLVRGCLFSRVFVLTKAASAWPHNMMGIGLRPYRVL